MNYLMAVSMKVSHSREHKRKDGLVEGHAYSLLQVVDVDGEQLLCLRNPWGKESEWKGRWSNNDNIWNRRPGLRDRLRPQKSIEDGLFWMCWRDFAYIWDNVTVCAKNMRVGQAAQDHSQASASGMASLLVSRGSNGSRPPPTGSLKLPVKPVQRLDCPGKHGLRRGPTPVSVFCDLCQETQLAGTVVFSCRTCNHDVCKKCVGRAPGVVEALSRQTAGENIPGRNRAKSDVLCIRIRCPNDHRLADEMVFSKRICCNLCDRKIPLFQQCVGCKKCDFYACLDCATKQTRDERTGRSRMAEAPQRAMGAARDLFRRVFVRGDKKGS